MFNIIIRIIRSHVNLISHTQSQRLPVRSIDLSKYLVELNSWSGLRAWKVCTKYFVCENIVETKVKRHQLINKTDERYL